MHDVNQELEERKGGEESGRKKKEMINMNMCTLFKSNALHAVHMTAKYIKYCTCITSALYLLLHRVS